MGAKASLEVVLYRGILRIARHPERDNAPDPESGRERWRESVRSLMLRQIQRRTGLVDEDGSLEGYVCACEGHNHDTAADPDRYAQLNAKDAGDRIRRLLGLPKPADLWPLEDADEDERQEAPAITAPVPAAPRREEEETPPPRTRVLDVPRRPPQNDRWRPSLADKVAHAKWGR